MKTFLVVLSPHGAPPGFFDASVRMAAGEGAALEALFVVDSIWFRYSGSDWLSTGPSRAEFDSYMHETLADEGGSQIEALSLAARRLGVAFSGRVMDGDTPGAAASLAGLLDADALIIPCSHPSLQAIRKCSGCPVLEYTPGLPLK